MSTYYMVLRLSEWSEIRVNVPLFPLPLQQATEPPIADSAGFMPVFTTRAAAEAWSEDGRFAVVELHTP
jgi:hypothetical protein